MRKRLLSLKPKLRLYAFDILEKTPIMLIFHSATRTLNVCSLFLYGQPDRDLTHIVVSDKFYRSQL